MCINVCLCTTKEDSSVYTSLQSGGASLTERSAGEFTLPGSTPCLSICWIKKLLLETTAGYKNVYLCNFMVILKEIVFQSFHLNIFGKFTCTCIDPRTVGLAHFNHVMGEYIRCGRIRCCLLLVFVYFAVNSHSKKKMREGLDLIFFILILRPLK